MRLWRHAEPHALERIERFDALVEGAHLIARSKEFQNLVDERSYIAINKRVEGLYLPNAEYYKDNHVAEIRLSRNSKVSKHLPVAMLPLIDDDSDYTLQFNDILKCRDGAKHELKTFKVDDLRGLTFAASKNTESSHQLIILNTGFDISIDSASLLHEIQHTRQPSTSNFANLISKLPGITKLDILLAIDAYTSACEADAYSITLASYKSIGIIQNTALIDKIILLRKRSEALMNAIGKTATDFIPQYIKNRIIN